MNYSDYKIEDWIVDDDFIAYVNGAKSQEIDRLKDNPDIKYKLTQAEKIVKGIHLAEPKIDSAKLDHLFDRINSTIDQPKEEDKEKPAERSKARIIQYRWIGIAAAAVAVLVIALPFFMASTGNHITSVAQQEEFILPDDSEVVLNSVSSVQYNKKTWNKNRYILLEGEAFFNVEKGSKFMVKSSQGSVTVLGTKFNVRDRIGLYEVECLEGSVRVNLESGDTYTLEQGDRIRKVKGQEAVLEKGVVEKIDWLNRYVEVENETLSQVFRELERNFDIKISNVDSLEEKKYSGFFSTVSLDSALQQILWPMNLEYEITNKKVVIK